ncbi:MAG: VWA domain-containing protein [Microbacteriaceae bacterium]|nr:VWA domain-containing protein [Microbacteriaceae bacterium]
MSTSTLIEETACDCGCHGTAPADKGEQGGEQDGKTEPTDRTDEGEQGEQGETSGEGGAEVNSDSEGEGDESDKSSNNGGGGGTAKGDKESAIEKIKNAIQDALAESANDSDVQNDMESAERSIECGNGKHSSSLLKSRVGYEHTEEVVTPELNQARKRFESECQRLVESCESGWERRTDSGRFSVNRYLDGADADEVFDRWEDGSDGADLEVVIAIDQSGSMDGQMETASEAAWVLARGLKSVRASVTTISFDDIAKVVYSPDDEARQYKKMAALGGTSATEVTAETHFIFQNSTRANKLVLFVTDGRWAGATQADALIATWRKQGVTTALAFISTSTRMDAERLLADSSITHGVEIAAIVNSTAEILPFGKSVITNLVRSRSVR